MFGETCPGSTGTLPTDYTFTGQRNEAGIGLMDYHARYYDPALGRFISADSIVPNAANPQDLNRYSYVRNNALRYTDPSGYYSEEEIMQAFGVSTWEQVLAFFGEDGSLEGRWGWLEILRRAEDGYEVEGPAPGCDEVCIGPASTGRFNRNEIGEILVGSEAHSEFALRYDEYTLHYRVLFGLSRPYPYHTRAGRIHYHPKYDWGRVDKEDIVLDAVGIGLSFLEAVPAVALAAMGAGWTLDAYSLSKDLTEWDRMGQPGPLEAPGIWFDTGVDGIGAAPGVGAVGDVSSILLTLWYGVHWTP
ncbi:MAG: RHS repeat-associated core domain-containing protein [Chloroflexota bacterium]|nr:RHS repeat-associated core domain-containing protein [Chloroflexota bacterium]